MKFYPFSSPSIDLPGVDLNTWFNPSPMSSYLVRAEGDSMTGAGIYSGSVLVVDRALEPHPSRVRFFTMINILSLPLSIVQAVALQKL